MYKALRNDRDILVLSNKYAEELRNLPSEQLNSIKALVRVRIYLSIFKDVADKIELWWTVWWY